MAVFIIVITTIIIEQLYSYNRNNNNNNNYIPFKLSDQQISSLFTLVKTVKIDKIVIICFILRKQYSIIFYKNIKFLLYLVC